MNNKEKEQKYCPHCHQPADVMVKVSHSSREGKWDAVCNDYANELRQKTDETNNHEISQFSGAYGLVYYEEAPLE